MDFAPRHDGNSPGSVVRPSTALLAAAAGVGAGAVIAALLPRGPVTTAAALALMAFGAAGGALAGWLLASRWAMLLVPLGYVVGFEVASMSSVGLTVDGPDLGSGWGLLALLVGRGFHGVVVLAPMVVGASLGAALRRRQRGSVPPRVTWGAWVRRAGVAVGGVALVAFAVLLARPAQVAPVTDAQGHPVRGSVAELVKVELNGADLWLSIRGRRADLPVVLYLPGGPGQSDLGLSRALLDALTDRYLVATLDGRGIGKAYASFDPKPTIERGVDDVLAATDYLRRRFAEDRIALFGESGGTITGVLAVRQAPEKYLAWIGSGQMVDPTETDQRIYDDLLVALRDAGDEDAVKRLRAYGRPPYSTPLANAFVMGHYELLAGDYEAPAAYQRRGERSGVGFMGLGASEYSLVDKVNAVRGLMDTFTVVYPTWEHIDLRRSAQRLDVPVYVFTGAHELRARRDLAVEWFARLDAPRKRLLSFADSGHATAFEHAEALRQVLVSLRPAPRRAGESQIS